METDKFDICVLGLGYIGLPTSSMFAARGKKVVGVDVRADVVEKLNRGEIHIKEPDLDVLVRAAVQSGNLVAKTSPAKAGVYIIAVPTPFGEASNSGIPSPDLSYVEAASRALAGVVPDDSLIILESTSPVGTTRRVKDWVEDEIRTLGREDVNLNSLEYVHCPERILPGQMLAELVSNDRIVGGLSAKASQRAEDLYRTFCNAEIIKTEAGIAEMVKLTENASRDVQIAFANELSMICSELNLNVWEVIRLANHHPRVNILNPGAGVGGHCIAVDPWFIINSCEKFSIVMKAARAVNDGKPEFIAKKVRELAGRFKDPIIGLLGLAFKPNVDDLRNSPAMSVVEELIKADVGHIIVSEPNVSSLPSSLESKVELSHHQDLIRRSDIVVCLVGHREFGSIDRAQIDDKVLIDACGLFQK